MIMSLICSILQAERPRSRKRTGASSQWTSACRRRRSTASTCFRVKGVPSLQHSGAKSGRPKCNQDIHEQARSNKSRSASEALNSAEWSARPACPRSAANPRDWKGGRHRPHVNSPRVSPETCRQFGTHIQDRAVGYGPNLHRTAVASKTRNPRSSILQDL